MIPLITVDDKLFVVVKQIVEKEDIDIEQFKNKTLSTHTYRKNGLLFFCQEVEDIKVVEDSLVV